MQRLQKMMGMTTNATATAESADKAIEHLQALGINFLALDFDQTILSIHTGGRWPGSAEELIPHIRPEFQQLVRAAVQSDISVGVVTFTGQISLVRACLEAIVKNPEVAAQMPIRGADRSWHYNGVGSQDGKQPHMASAVEELMMAQKDKNNNVVVTKQSTVLVDDDPRNIKYALHDGTRAVWFNPAKPNKLFENILKLV